MDHVALAFPILPGQTGAARTFQKDLDTTRKSDYAKSEKRIGVHREYWYIADLPSGEHLLAFFDADDVNAAFAAFIQSQDPFDLWFKQSLNDVTGVDLANLPPGMKLPELVSTYES
jgi:hypothetical protein